MKLILSAAFALILGASALASQSILITTTPELPSKEIGLVNDIMANPNAAVEPIMQTTAAAGPPPVPEPATLLLLGAAGSLFMARRKKA